MELIGNDSGVGGVDWGDVGVFVRRPRASLEGIRTNRENDRGLSSARKYGQSLMVLEI